MPVVTASCSPRYAFFHKVHSTSRGLGMRCHMTEEETSDSQGRRGQKQPAVVRAMAFLRGTCKRAQPEKNKRAAASLGPCSSAGPTSCAKTFFLISSQNFSCSNSCPFSLVLPHCASRTVDLSSLHPHIR